MGYLLNIFLAVGIVALGELELDAGIEARGAVWGGTLALALVPHLLARTIRKLSLAGSFRRAQFVMVVLGHAAPLLFLASVMGFGWVRFARGVANPSDGDLFAWPEPSLLLSLAPYVLYECLAIDARNRVVDDRARERRRMLGFQVRMFLSGFLPLVLYVLLSWLVGLVPGLRVQVEGVALYGAVFGALLLIAFALVLPLLLKSTWETAPLEPGIQRSVLLGIAERAGFRYRSLLVWRTGHLMANAAIIGFLPWHRIVLFSDALLTQLSLRQLAAVFAHEIGHARHHHVLVFGAFGLAFFLAGDLALTTLPLEATWAPAALLFVFGAFWYVGFGYLSRRFELEADLVGLDLTGDPESLTGALDQVAGMHGRHRTTWRHFSVEDRKLFLRAAARDPGVGSRLRRTLAVWRRVAWVAFALAALAEAWLLTTHWSEDRLWVDLRLGRFSAAQERAASWEGADPELTALAERATTFPDGTEADVLADAALEALQNGLLVEARDRLWLAVLRGADELAPAGEVLDHLLEPDREAARRVLGELREGRLPRAWEEALASLAQ